MIYSVLASENDTFINYMNHYLSHYSQQSSVEISAFSHHSLAHILAMLERNRIKIVFFDIEDKRHEEWIGTIRQRDLNLLCVGVGRSNSATLQSRLFSLGMDDYLTIPMAHELFQLRMRTLLRQVEHRELRFVKEQRAESRQELYSFDSDDIEDFDEILKHLHSQILLMGKSEIAREDVYEITFLLGKLQSRFMYLVATFVLSHTLRDLCEAIEEHVDTFILQSAELHTIALSFVNDLIRWKSAVLHERSQKADFLNDSIVANAQMFAALLEGESQSGAASLDAIFDF